MKNRSFFVLLITVSLLTTYNDKAADLTQKSVSEAAYKSTMSLMNQVINSDSDNFFKTGFSADSRDQWEQAIDSLQAYLNKSKSSLISQSNLNLFNGSIQELKSSTKDLFETVDYFGASGYFGTEATPSELADKVNKLQSHMANINKALDQLQATKFSDFKGTKDLKALFANLLEAWKQVYVKAHSKMRARVAAVETVQSKEQAKKQQEEQEQQAKLARLKEELKSIEIKNNMIAYAEKKISSQPEQAAATLDNLQHNIGNQLNNTDLTRNDYLVAVKELLKIRKLYAQLPKSIQIEGTVKNIKNSLRKAIAAL